MKKVLTELRKELKANVDQVYKKNCANFFKEKVKCYGVRVPVVRKIAIKYFKELKGVKKEQVFALAEELLKADYNEEAVIAFDWVFRLRKDYEKKDLKIFERWIKLYVNNWGKCDDFCNHSVGELVLLYSEFIKDLKRWTKSPNQWLRRAAAVTLILPVRKGKFKKQAFEISDLLLEDKEDLVQKGYGWLLKEASKRHQKDVFDYVMKNKKKMPRTALRYAIEKMPADLKKQAMKI